MIKNKFSVLMSVYKNDKPEWVGLAIDSIINQSLSPDEIILIIDGPVSKELLNEIDKNASKYKTIKVLRNEQNIGLGLTLQKGINYCSNEIVARMDSDDISKPNRFETQMKKLIDEDLDLVGSAVEEFIDNYENVVSLKKVPSSMKKIAEYAKLRNPFCHPTVMFKKSKVLESGNYQDMKLCEDYYLWIRMIQNNCKMDNIPEPLLRMRTSTDLYARRGGLSYYKKQKELLKYMYKTKFINGFTYTKSKIIRFIVQVLMPNNLRQKFYLKKLRK